MALNALEQIEGGARARAVAFRLQPHAHDAVKNESEEADHGVGADAIRQAVVDRGDLDVGFQHAKAALDVREALVARDGVGGREVWGVGDQREFAVEEFGLGNSLFVDVPAEPVRIEIGLYEPRELSRSRSACLSSVGSLMSSLPVSRPAISAGLKFGQRQVLSGTSRQWR